MIDVKVKVTNTGERERSRLGVSVKPGKTRSVTVTNPRDLLTLRAVRDFDVSDVGADAAEVLDEGASGASAGAETDNSEADVDVSAMTVDEVLAAVASGEVSVEDALAAEQAGKNRSSLVKQLSE